MISENYIENLIKIFNQVCNEYKPNINRNKLKEKEYFLKQIININYLLVAQLTEHVDYIDSSELIRRLYTNNKNNNNLGIYIKPLFINKDLLQSSIYFISNNMIINFTEFVY